MRHNHNYSERSVNPDGRGVFRILIRNGGKLPDMAADQPVAAYVRFRLLELRRAGRKDTDLADAGDLAPSNISQVRSGKLGVGARTQPKFAKILGVSPSQLAIDAHKWWAKDGKRAEQMVAIPATENPEQAEAIEVVKGLVSATAGQLEAVISAFGADRFAGRDKAWWVRTLLDELERDRREQAGDKAAHSVTRGKQAQHRRLTRDLAEAKSTPGRASKPPAKAAG